MLATALSHHMGWISMFRQPDAELMYVTPSSSSTEQQEKQEPQDDQIEEE